MQKRIMKIISLILTLILLSGIIVPVVSKATEETVTITFKDKNLYNAMIKKIGRRLSGKNDDTNTIVITRSELNKITSLDLYGNQISDISGLASLTNLTWLVLKCNQISDISSLASLTNLTSLDLYGNQISDISSLASLTKLIDLNLSWNQISDISSLASLTKLTYLTLGGNQISDISSLASLTNLTRLYLDDNQISDISSLASLTNLTYLGLWDNQISDISSLTSLTNLTRLDLRDNLISDINSLASLKNLTSLDLYGNKISDISSLAGLTNLESLNLKNNKIYTKIIDNTIKKEEIPNIIKETLNPQSVVFSEDGLEYTNCTVNNNGDIILNNGSKDASISVKSGNAGGTTWHIQVADSKEIKFNDENLYNVIKECMDLYERESKVIPSYAYKMDDKNKTLTIMEDYINNITYLDLSNSNIEDVSGLQEFTNLHTLILDNNKIKNIEILSQLQLDTLQISNNELKDFRKLAGFKSVKTLIARNNEFKNINSIENLTNLKILDLGYNEITNISKLATLPQIECIRMYNNAISDISVLENVKYKNVNFRNNNIEKYGNFDFDIGYFENNEITETITGSGIITDTEEIELPDIFLKTRDSSSKLYAPDSLVCDGCEIQGDNVIVKKGTKEAKVVINNGPAKGTTFKIIAKKDTMAPSISINSELESDKSKKLVTIKANEDIKDVWGWERADSKTIYKTFEYNVKNETVEVEDLYGNKTTTVIEVSGVKRNYSEENEDLGTEYYVEYSKSGPTTEDVTVTITAEGANPQISLPHSQGDRGWTISDDRQTLTKIFKENEDTTVELINQGKPIFIPIIVSNIDREGPACNVEYSTTSVTNEYVDVTIVSNEKLQTVDSWTRDQIEDKYILSKRYYENADEDVIVQDLAGNSSTVNVKVNNIKKGILNLDYKYSILAITRKDVTININADENIQEVNKNVNARAKMRLKQSENNATSNTINKTYSENIVEAVTVKDDFDNEDFVAVGIYNIDKTELIASKPEYIQNADGTVTVKIVANKIINPIEGWNGWNLDSSKKVLTKVYDSNKKETLKITDIAGNEVNAEVDVNTINPGLEIISVTVEKIETEVDKEIDDEKYDDFGFIRDEQIGEYKVTITASNEIKDVFGWEKSFDGRSISKMFTEDGKETVEIEDYYGNKKTVEIDVRKLLNINDNDIPNKDENKEEDQPEDKNQEEKKEDNTQSNKILPKTGEAICVGAIISIIVAVVAVIWNNKKMKNIDI